MALMALVLPLLLLQHNFVMAFHGPAQQHTIRLAEESLLLGDLKHQLHETPHQKKLKKLQRKFQRLNQLENAVDDLLRQRFASNEVRSNILFAKHVVDPFVKNGFIISKGEQPGTCSPELTNRTNRLYADCCIRHDSSKAAFIQQVKDYFEVHSQTIPRVIHQIWLSDSPPDSWMNTFRVKFINTHPNWRYELWTAERVARLHLFNRAAFDAEPSFAGKADILRYELVYKFGGIYVDADMAWLGTRDLGDLIAATNASGLFLAHECQHDPDAFANSVIGASQYNPLMYLTVRALGRSYATCEGGPAYKVTGPFFLDQVLHDSGITVFPHHYFFPRYWVDNSGGLTGNRSMVQLLQKAAQFPKSFMWHFGYTTNGMQDVVRLLNNASRTPQNT